MDEQIISLVSFGYFGKDLLDSVSEEVEKEFRYTIMVREGHLDLSDFYDPARRQYNGNSILKVIDDRFAEESQKTLALFSVDLYIPILTYIFGQAMLNGRTGIASLYRLSNERYGLPKNDALLLERFVKEVIHELGHLFGRAHCQLPTCVMRSSTYVEDIDQKSKHFCIPCREAIFKF